MTTNRPGLYKRDASELRKQIEQDLHDTIQWQGQKDGAGQGMVQLFGRLAEIIIDRLNRVPEQHFLAFLNEGGIDQLPPQAASTKMAFLAEKDGRPAIQVPAGTQVATRATGGKPEVIFETEHDIQVIPTELVRCIAVDQRTYTDRTDQANKQAPGSFAAFQGDTVRERVLYLGQDALLDLPDPAVRARTVVTLLVEIEPTVGTVPDAWDLVWLYWDGKEWSSLAASGATIQDSTANLSRSGEVTVTALPELGKTKVNDAEGVWIACQLIPRGEHVTLPPIRRIHMAREIVVPEEQALINSAFTGTQAGVAFAPLKPGDVFYPFGQRPELLDGLYLQADEALLKPGATVELRMDVQGLPAEPSDISELAKLKVDWEYFSTEGWIRLGSSTWGSPQMEFLDRSDPLVRDVRRVMHWPGIPYLEIDLPDDFSGDTPPPSLPNSTLRYHMWTARPYAEMKLPAGCELLSDSVIAQGRAYHAERLGFRDTTCAFTASGSGVVSFTVPVLAGSDPLFASTEVNGRTGHWIRARIVDGSYSVPRPKPGGLISKLLIGDLPQLPPEPLPPLVDALTVYYTNYHAVDPPGPLQRCWSKTDQRWRSHGDGQPFAPFTTSVEHRALYLGFNPLDLDPLKAGVAFPPNTWIEIFLDVEEVGDESILSRVLWEYWNGARSQWQELATVDETRGLWRQGTLGFYGPPDHKPSSEFGVSAYWLRVSPKEVDGQGSLAQPAVESAVAWMSRLNAIRLNTVHAINAETTVDELLGASNGEKDQALKLVRSPVLSDLQIEVREPGEQLNQLGEAWVRWDRVSNFNACGPNSRCFMLDAVTGTILFGNGLRGMIPPAGQNNIRAKYYRTHADVAGNLAVNTVTAVRNPKDALNEIRLVTNFEPASGGSGPEETAAVMQRAPYSLKNRQRAVAQEDFEWLAREVKGARRVFCLPTRQSDGSTKAGWVTVVVVPDPTSAVPGSADRHSPSPDLLREVRAHLERRGLTNLARPEVGPGAGLAAAEKPDQDRIHVARPGFVEVKVSVQVVPKDVTKADNTRNDILRQLQEFLDPLAGGPDRDGWEPGRNVYVSEIAAEIEGVPGVDHVHSITLQTPTRQQQQLQLSAGADLPYDMPAGSQVSTLDERIKLILGASLPKTKLPKTDPLIRLNAYGLNTGDEVLFIAGDAVVQAETRLARQLVDLVEITFDHPIEFSSKADFAKWLKDLGDAPGLTSADRRFWLPVPFMGQNAQFDRTTDKATGKVTLRGVTVMGLKAGDCLQVGDKIGFVGAVGSRPLDVRHVSRLDNRFWVVFDLPVDFENSQAFKEWTSRLGNPASLSSSDRRIRLPITRYDRIVDGVDDGDDGDAIGRLHLTGVIVQGLTAEEPVSLTHATHRHRRVDYLPLQRVSPWVDQQRIFVPADHMVCSGSHEITMIVEAAHAS